MVDDNETTHSGCRTISPHGEGRRIMRRRTLVLAGAVLMTAVTACSGGDKPKAAAPAPTTGAPASTAPSTTSSSSSSATATTIAVTTTAAATTTAVTTTASTAPAAETTTTLIDCRDLNGPGTCQQTVPLRADVDEIIEAYRRFAAEELKIGQNPDNPDWDAYLALVNPTSRDNARADLQGHFDRGEILDTSLGVTIAPRSTQAPNLPDDFHIIEDCRVDGSYWADRATGQPVAGANSTVRRMYFLADMRRVDGRWFVSAFRHLDQPC